MLPTNNAQDIAFPQAGAAGGVQQDIVAKQRGNPRLRWHVQVAQRRADAPLIGPQLVDKLLPRVFRVNIQPDAGDGPADGRHHHFGFFAAHDSEVPCSSSDTSTTKKATLKNRRALSVPAIIGNTARIMGTAPRRPTQLINTRSRRLKPRNGSRPANTDRGRAMNIIHIDSSSAGIAIGSRSEGVTSRPSTVNMAICASHAVPSKFCRMPCRLRIGRLPSRKPQR